MRRRSSGSAEEEEGDGSASNAGITSNSSGGSSKYEQPITKKESTSTSITTTTATRSFGSSPQKTARQSNPHIAAHELDRRKSTDQRPSTARSRLPSAIGDGQIEKKRAVEPIIDTMPAEESIAVEKMLASRSRSQNTRRSRLRSPWSCSLLTFVTTTVAALTLFAILHSFTSQQIDTKGCRMSFMRPSFAKLDDFDTEHTRFASKYSVYLYREGGVDEDTKVRAVLFG